MGCDIHAVLEQRVADKWVGIHAFPDLDAARVFGRASDEHHYLGWIARERCYAFFAQLASVRGESERKPLGVPPDASDLARIEIEKWNGDGHSHSVLSARCFAECYAKAGYDERHGSALNELLGQEVADSPDDYRVVFWFDN